MLLTNIVLLLIILVSFLKMGIVMEVSISAITNFMTILFPSMFFSLVLFKLLIQNGFIKQISKRISILSYSTITYGILSCLLGFASGSLLLKDAYDRNEISKKDVECVAYCCCMPSFSFFITIGTLIKDLKFGILLYAIQIIYSFFLLSLHSSSKCVLGNQKATLHSIKDAIQSSSVGLYSMLGYIILVRVSLVLLTQFFPLPLQIGIEYLGEFASSSIQIIHSSLPLTNKYLLLSLVLGFGSFSAHLQTFALLPVQPSYWYYLVYRIGQGLFSSSIVLLYILIFLH